MIDKEIPHWQSYVTGYIPSSFYCDFTVSIWRSCSYCYISRQYGNDLVRQDFVRIVKNTNNIKIAVINVVSIKCRKHSYKTLNRSSRSEIKKTLQYLRKNTCVGVSFKLQVWWPATLLKRLQHKCFPRNITKLCQPPGCFCLWRHNSRLLHICYPKDYFNSGLQNDFKGTGPIWNFSLKILCLHYFPASRFRVAIS